MEDFAFRFTYLLSYHTKSLRILNITTSCILSQYKIYQIQKRATYLKQRHNITTIHLMPAIIEYINND